MLIKDFNMTQVDPISPDFSLLVSISPVGPIHLVCLRLWWSKYAQAETH